MASVSTSAGLIVDREQGDDKMRTSARTADEVTVARIAAARSHPLWTEIDASVLVSRGRRLRVDTDTDEIYDELPPRAAVFAPGSASIVADRVALCFAVDGDVIRFFEKTSQTWSQVMGARGSFLRGHARKAAKARAR